MRRTRLLPVLCLLVLLPGGCKKPDSKDKTASPQAGAAPAAESPPVASNGSREMSANPAVLLDPSIKPAQFEWYGVKVGDPATAIPSADVTAGPDDSGWIGFKGKENVFRLDGDKVAAISLTDAAVLGGLNVASEEDLKTRFGPPDQIIEAGEGAPEVTYLFNARGLTVVWNRKAGKLAVVTIGS